jgi:Transglycosylase SLT domain
MTNGSDLSYPGFIERVEEIAKKYNADADTILAALAKESNIKSTAINYNFKTKKGTKAAGLFQVLPGVALEMGTTTEKILAMNPLQQLDLFDKHLNRWRKINEISDYSEKWRIYATIGLPSKAGKSQETTAYSEGSSAVKENPTWDVNKDGKIQAGELLMDLKTDPRTRGFFTK